MTLEGDYFDLWGMRGDLMKEILKMMKEEMKIGCAGTLQRKNHLGGRVWGSTPL